MFLKAYALTGIQTNTYIKSYHFVFHTHTHLRYTLMGTYIYKKKKKNIEENCDIFIYMSQFSYKILTFGTGK
jgi:hypothetical protein